MRVERLISSNPERTERLRNHAEWLLKLGDGRLPSQFVDVIEVPQHMVCDGPSQLEEKVYADFENNTTDRD